MTDDGRRAYLSNVPLDGAKVRTRFIPGAKRCEVFDELRATGGNVGGNALGHGEIIEINGISIDVATGKSGVQSRRVVRARGKAGESRKKCFQRRKIALNGFAYHFRHATMAAI